MADEEVRHEGVQAEREARIRELEARLARRNPVGVRTPLAILGIAAAVALLWMNRLEIAYAFTPREPLVLGQEGDYRLGQLTSNRYAQIHGVPTVRGVYTREGSDVYVIVGLRDTPILVRRHALGGEDWKPGRTPPQPDQRPFKVGGRLLAEDDAWRYRDAFAKLKEWGEVHPANGKLWLLIEGQRPGEDRGMLGVAALLVGVIVLNVWFLWRLFAARREPAAG